LRDLKLEKYEPKLSELGISSIDQFKEVSETDLD
jgi:hypothetical protein